VDQKKHYQLEGKGRPGERTKIKKKGKKKKQQPY